MPPVRAESLGLGGFSSFCGFSHCSGVCSLAFPESCLAFHLGLRAMQFFGFSLGLLPQLGVCVGCRVPAVSGNRSATAVRGFPRLARARSKLGYGRRGLSSGGLSGTRACLAARRAATPAGVTYCRSPRGRRARSTAARRRAPIGLRDSKCSGSPRPDGFHQCNGRLP